MGSSSSSPKIDFQKDLFDECRKFSDLYKRQLLYLSVDLSPDLRYKIFFGSNETMAINVANVNLSSKDTSTSMLYTFIDDVSGPIGSRQDLAARITQLSKDSGKFRINVFSNHFTKDYSQNTEQAAGAVLRQCSTALSQGYNDFKAVLFLPHGVYVGAAFCYVKHDDKTTASALSVFATSSKPLLDLILQENLVHERLALLTVEGLNSVKVLSHLCTINLQQVDKWMIDSVTLNVLEDKSKEFSQNDNSDKFQNNSNSNWLINTTIQIINGKKEAFIMLLAMTDSLIRYHKNKPDKFKKTVAVFRESLDKTCKDDLDVLRSLTKLMLDDVSTLLLAGSANSIVTQVQITLVKSAIDALL